jgi:DNA-binding NarL/FixJ family response regulator
MAASIPGARLVPFETDNHVPLAHEPSFGMMFEELEGFLPPRAAKHAAIFPALTLRERQILEHIARGLDNAQIAAHLDLAEKTVRNNITAIFDKLAVENRAQAIVRAREAGLGQGRR